MPRPCDGVNDGLGNKRAASRAAGCSPCRAILTGMLQRGFTTVRYTGGAHASLAEAISAGLTPGPRLFTCGKGALEDGSTPTHAAATTPTIPIAGQTIPVTSAALPMACKRFAAPVVVQFEISRDRRG